jgi:uncharacterized protein YjbJ (UPF0337 family)
MNTTEIKGNWSEMNGRFKQQFAVLTDNELKEMIGRLQIKLGKTKEEIHKILADLK